MKTAAVSAFFLACLTIVPALHAAPVASAAGDLILGFNATAGDGVAINLEVNLGPASSFFNAAPGSSILLDKLSVLDLKAAYGDNWAARPDLFWGVVGATGLQAVGTAPARTLWASRAVDTPGTASVPYQRQQTFTQQVPSQNIINLYGTTAPGSLSQFNATPNSAFSANVDASLAGSWVKQESFTSGVSFSYFNLSLMKAVNTFPVAGSTYDGTAYTVHDLYELRPGPLADATRLGAIGLNAAGKLVFSTDITKFAPPSTSVELGQPTLTLNGNAATVILTGAPTGSYVLERSPSMLPTSWNAILTPQSPASGTLTYVDTPAPGGRSFYRIRKLP